MLMGKKLESIVKGVAWGLAGFVLTANTLFAESRNLGSVDFFRGMSNIQAHSIPIDDIVKDEENGGFYYVVKTKGNRAKAYYDSNGDGVVEVKKLGFYNKNGKFVLLNQNNIYVYNPEIETPAKISLKKNRDYKITKLAKK